MCRVTADAQDTEVLERLQQRLQEQLNLNCGQMAMDHLAHLPTSRGSGPRVFVGHVPPECSEELVKAHFSQWGHVTDVYFPKRKDTFRRRPFCFVTFARLEDAQRALAESPMNICGIPIKQLNLVEDRVDYYKHRHTAAQTSLVQALQTLAMLGGADGAAAQAAVDLGRAASAPAPAASGPLDIAHLTALLSGAAQPQCFPTRSSAPISGFHAAANSYAPAPMPVALSFGALPGFQRAPLTAAPGAAALAMPAAAPAYYPPMPQPGFAPPPASECRLSSGSEWGMASGATSPFSILDAAGPQHVHTSSSPPKPAAAHGAPTLLAARSLGNAAPSDFDAVAVDRLAMWRLQAELLAGEAGAAGSAGVPPPPADA